MNYYFLTSDGELYHYGIKGQKWGVRRFQNKNGTLTSRGKDRYAYDSHDKAEDPKSDTARMRKITSKELREYRHEMIDRYEGNAEKQKFYKESNDDNIRRDISRKQTTKKVLIGAAVAAGIGVGIYCAYKHNALGRVKESLDAGKKLTDTDTAKIMKEALDDTDIVLGKNTVLHRMTAYKDIDFSKISDPTYVSYKRKDVLTYMTQLKDWSGTGERYDVSLRATKDIRIPSKDKAQKIFDELWKSDSQYKDSLQNTIQKTYTELLKKQNPFASSDAIDAAAKRMSSRDISKDPFKMGIYSIVRKGDDTKTLVEKFKQHGYDAIEDYFDKGTFTDSPVILFDPSSTVVKTGEQFVTDFMKQQAMRELRGM